jgi:flavin-dependent dehydrogenase
MMVMPDGYLGVVRQADGVTHCAGLVALHAGAQSREPMDFARRGLRQLGDSLRIGIDDADSQGISRFEATGPMPWRPSSVANAKVALVGDAAGYIEPFTGEGMGWALQSASLLLRTLSEQSAGCWTRDLADLYQRDWNRCIGARQRACRAVAMALARPRLFSLAMRVARRHPALPRKFAQWVHA